MASTPGAVLLANLGFPEAEVQATLLRVVSTLTGAVIAAVIALLLEDADRESAQTVDP